MDQYSIASQANKDYLQTVHISDFNISLTEESVDLFIDVFSKPPWNDIFESKSGVIDFFNAFTGLPNFKGYQLTDNNKVIGISIGFIKPWLKNGELRYEYFIDQLCIDHTLQGKGLGKYFMAEIGKRLKDEKISDIILNTERSSGAYHFYNKIGFSEMKEYGFLLKEL